MNSRFHEFSSLRPALARRPFQRRPVSKFPATSVYVSEEPESLRKGRRKPSLAGADQSRTETTLVTSSTVVSPSVRSMAE